MYYLDVNFYRYFIGRDDQSVNETVMIGRIDQQIRVTKLMLGYYDVMKQAAPLHDPLSGDYDDCFLHSGYPLRDRGKSGEEKGTVAVFKEAEPSSLYPPALGIFRTRSQSAGKERQKGVYCLL